MSSFFNQVGQLSSNLGHSLGSSVGHALQQGLQAAPEELRIGSHSIIVKEKIAEGGFGLIELVEEIHTQKELVLKRCNIDREAVFQVVKKEISILQKFSGPYITKLIGYETIQKGRSKEALLLLEYYPGGHLLHRLNNRQGTNLPAETLYRIFGQILMGVKSFHENAPPIINRDLKLENILFGLDGKVRLCDFGSCMESPIYVRNASEREKVEESIQKETTQMYRAPEMVDLYMRQELTEKTDIWALGCIFYSMCFLKHPFQDQSNLAILQAKFTIPANSPYSAETTEFMLRMLDIDPEARPTVGELLNYLAEIASGRPLPPHQLSAEAIRRREERIAADQLRESKSKKNKGPVVPDRKGAPPASSSVAAKRLAAKRGQPLADDPVESFGSSNKGTVDFQSDFSEFNTTGNSSNAFGSSSVNQAVSFGGEDIFASHSTAATSNAFAANEVDLFASTSTAAQSFGADFDEFGSTTAASSSAHFDAFASDNAHNPSSSNFDAFSSDFASQSDVRRPSGDRSSFASSVPVIPAAAPSKPAVKKSAAALLFGSEENDVQPVEVTAPSSSTFDPFDGSSSSQHIGSTTQPASDGFDHSNFATSFDAFSSSTATRASGTASFVSGFDEFTPTVSSQATTAKVSNTFDPFATSSVPPHQSTSSNKPSSFGAFASDGFDNFAPSSTQQETSMTDTFQGSFDHFSSSGPSKPVTETKPVSVASAPVDLFNFDHVVPADVILTPTPLAPAPAPQVQGFDLLDTNFPQSQSNKPANPMDLLSLYDQPKPEAGAMSGSKPAMRNSSILISNIAVPGQNNGYPMGAMGAPAGYSMNSNNSGMNSLDSIPLPGMPAPGSSNRRQSYMGIHASNPYQAMPPSYTANSYFNSMPAASSTTAYQPKPTTNQRASITSANTSLNKPGPASPGSTMKYFDNPLKKSPKSGGGSGGADPFGDLNVLSNK